MRAWKKPLRQRPGVEPFLVELIARTGRGKITVRGVNEGAPFFAAEPFLLFAENDRSQRIAEDELNKLPWRGAGPDPATASTDQLVEHLARA